MNERIKELAEQAGMMKILNEHAHEYGNGLFENTKYPELEKFAELIVRECARVAFNDWCEGTNESSSEMAILKHFGVEE